MPFDYKAALAEGASEDEILRHLTKTRNFDIEGAMREGATKEAIIQHLSSTSAPTWNSPSSALNTAKDVGIGFLKGAGRTLTGQEGAGISIIKGAGTAMGKRIAPLFGTAGRMISGVSSLPPVQNALGAAGDYVQGLEDKLQASNTAQKVGGYLETAAEFLLPTGGKANAAKEVAKKTTKIAPFAKSVLPDVIKAAKEEGIELPASAINKSPIVRGSEALAGKGFFGARIQKVAETAREKIKGMADTIETTLKQADSLTTEQVGKFIKKGFSEYVDKFNTEKTKLYDTISVLAGSAKAKTTNTLSVLDDIIKQKISAGSAVNQGETNYFKGILDDLMNSAKKATEQKPSGLLSPDGTPIPGSTTPGTPALPNPAILYNNLKAMRTEIGYRLQSSDPIATGNKAQLKRLYAALSDDLDETAKAVSPKVAEMIDNVNSFYKTTITKINSVMGKRITNADPEDLVKQFVKPNNVTEIRQLAEVVGKESFDKVSSSFMTDLVKNSLDKNGAFDPAKFVKNVQKYDRPTLEALLSKEQLMSLDAAVAQSGKHQLLSGAMTQGAKMAEGSQTAFLGRLGFTGAALYAHPIATIAGLIGERQFAHFIASPSGRKFVTSGIEISASAEKLMTDLVRRFGRTAILNAPSAYDSQNRPSQ